ncbi:MAG: CarD family transcriptional regulator [Anaerolineales bacterium]|jgi:CarD family transcriptional regulator
MGFQIGDKVIHCSFGLGDITAIEEKTINGHSTNCYVVSITDMTVWIPIDDLQQNSLRAPTPPEEFIKTLPILTSPTENLLEDRVLRKNQLTEQLKDGQLASICRVVRDLTHYQRNSKLNDQEKSILERAVRSLLTEWTLSLGTPFNQAHQAMESMLQS